MDLTHNFTPGTRAVAQQVNQNFADVKSAVDPLEVDVADIKAQLGGSDFIKSDGSVDFTRLQSYKTYVVSNATNATPIVVTAVAHGFLTGDKVKISGVGGNTAANGIFTITKIGADTFSLNDSVGNGAYTSGGIGYLVPQNPENFVTMGDLSAISNQPTSFSINSGKVDNNGNPDLLDITDTSKIVFNVDSTTPLKGTLANEASINRTSLPDLSVSALANGTYNLFIGTDGACVPLANNIFRQKKEPTTPILNNVWLNTSVKPYVAKKYNGTTFEDFNYVPLPQNITIASGAITAKNMCDVGFGENWQTDGNFIFNPTVLASNITLSQSSSLSYDLSSILPKDSYVYECVISAHGYMRAELNIYSDIIKATTYDQCLSVMGGGVYASTTLTESGGTTKISVGIERKINVGFYNSSVNSTGVYINLIGYRRIGVN